MSRNLKSLILFCLLLIGVSSHFWFPRLITEIKNPVMSLFRPAATIAGISSAKILEIPIGEASLMTASMLKTKYPDPKGLVILIHGIRGQKETFNGLARRLSKAGFHSVAIDLRGHGQNTAKHCTFGAKEKEDLSKLIDHLIEEENINCKIGVWGISLGGAVALQAMPNEKRIKFAVIESAFSNLNKTVHNYFRHFAGFDIPPISNYMLKRAGKIAGFDPSITNPSDACTKIHQTVLLVHGDQDVRIPIQHAEQNFKNLLTKNKELYIVAGANHGSVWATGGEKYFDKVFEFLENVKE